MPSPDRGAWVGIGLSCLVGLTAPLWYVIGPNAGAYVSYELKTRGSCALKAMTWATFVNGMIGIAVLVLL
ncbi:hypothetical protein BJ546DRAFT_839029 [Cryomyces antarcticus]